MKKFARYSAIILIIYSAICGFMYLQQDQLLYHPSAAVAPPQPPHFEFKTATGHINVWHKSSNKAQAILYFGGNGESVELTMNYLSLAIPESDMYFMSYRGYSGSTGKPSEKAIIEDAMALYDYLKKDYAHISLIGRSLGTAVAIALASQREVEKLALVTPFNSISAIAQDRYPWIPVSLLIRDSYDSMRRVKRIKSPILVFTAELDEVTPKKNSAPLLAAFKPSQLTHIYLQGVGHNNLSRHVYYLTSLHAFLKPHEVTSK